MRKEILICVFIVFCLFSCKSKNQDPTPAVQTVQYNIHVNNPGGVNYTYTISASSAFTAINKASVNNSVSFTVTGTDGPICTFATGSVVTIKSTDTNTYYTIYKNGILIYSSTSYVYSFIAN